MIKKRILTVVSVVLLVLNISANAQAQSLQVLRQTLSEIAESMQSILPIALTNDMFITGFTYDEAANVMTMKYLIDNPEIFNVYLTTPHSQLQKQTLESLAATLGAVNGEEAERMHKAFAQVDPHVVCQYDNGAGTKVKCEFQGRQIEAAMKQFSELTPAAQARNVLQSQAEAAKKMLPMRVDDITTYTNFSIYNDEGFVEFEYELSVAPEDMPAVRNNALGMRRNLEQSLAGNPLFDLVRQADYSIRFKYYCAGHRNLKPLTIVISAEELNSL